ncbi:MAG: carboxypeptidase-like regulatory domain-containing protein, partial [Bacteroidota bacterium]
MKVFFFLLFASISAGIFAQKITYSGTITEAESGETLPGVLVFCPDTDQGTSSNNYGFYSLTLPMSAKRIIVQFMGYEAIEFTLIADAPRQDIRMNKLKLDLNTVVVEGVNSTNVVEETQMSSIEIPIDQIKKIPALLGEKDVLKVIQLLPGVQKGSEGSSGFYVRGGGPDQNLIILDDATVYNANHLFGFFSIFNGDALKSVELIKGGFPARYGGRLSSVLEMQMKD